MNALKDGWFSEVSPDLSAGGSWPGQAFSLQVEEVLFAKKSDYQDVLVFKSKSHGNVLVLDGIIQCTERDEFSYHEMLAHLPLFAHPDPKKVLIIGGGDGGIAREVLKHKCVEKVILCEIDGLVVEASKQHLPSIASEFANPRLELVIADGTEYLKNHKAEFDVIITDSSDPIGPAQNLYGQTFYGLLKGALKEGGIVASQGETPWLDLDMISSLYKSCKTIFPQVRYAIGSVPTYTSGTMGYLLCGLDSTIDLTSPTRANLEALNEMHLKFYNFEVHKAAFSLPNFIRDAFG